MLELLIAILFGLAAPAYTTTTTTDDSVITATSTVDGDTDTGGETGHIPPKPPTTPTPPTP